MQSTTAVSSEFRRRTFDLIGAAEMQESIGSPGEEFAAFIH